MNLNEFFAYKNQLMKDLCHNRNIIKLLTEKQDVAVPNHTIAYSQIFPFEFIPETVNDGQTFICFDVDVADVINKTFYMPVIYIWVFTHKSKLRLPGGGVRTDKICEEVDKILNGNRYYGLGTLDLKSVGRFSPILDYQGRVMTYTAVDFNRSGSKPAPSKRR